MSVQPQSLKSPVAVTGLGVVSPLGHDTQSTWDALMRRQSGMADIQQFDAHAFPVRFAAEVTSYQPRVKRVGKHHRFTMPFTQFALDAADEALQDAGILPASLPNPKRFGVLTGSGMMTGEFDHLHRFQQFCASNHDAGEIDWSRLAQEGDAFYQLADFGKTASNSGLSLLIQQFGITGYANSVHTACASGGQALGMALEVIRRGEADVMLAGGFDSMINPLGVASFCLLGALSNDNHAPTQASRPFDATRNGFVLGEGAAFLVLERLETAKARGAKIYAMLAGQGNSLSAYRITDSHPNGDGAIQAVSGALKDAGLGFEDIDYINAHGTSTKMNDLSETNAIKAVFQSRAKTIPMSSTKSQTGHLIAAAGALEAVLSSLAIHHATIPMTQNLRHPDQALDLDYVADGPREKAIGAVLSNSFGFGGSNSSLVFTHPDFMERIS